MDRNRVDPGRWPAALGIPLCPLLALLPSLAGCPDIGSMTYRFDLETGRGTLRVTDIGTDAPESAALDFAVLVDDYQLGDKLREEHPGWNITDRRMFEVDGRLDGIVEFSFSSPEDVGLYKHDKKSPYFWCAPDGLVVSTSGSVMGPYPNCVAFDRKARQLEVTVSTSRGQNHTSLLPQFQSWDGKPIPMPLPGGAGIDTIGDALRQAIGGDAAPMPLPESVDRLGQALPKLDAAPGWKALGLPLPQSQVVYQSDASYQATHPSTTPEAVLAAYGEALGRAGFAVAETSDGAAVWQRAGERIRCAATQAGANVIASLTR